MHDVGSYEVEGNGMSVVDTRIVRSNDEERKKDSK